MGIYKEKSLPDGISIVLLLLSFLVLFQPWNLELRELSRLEGLFAAEAQDLSLSNWLVVSAHGAIIHNAFPLYPILVRLLYDTAGISMELALRLVSLFMLFATAILVYLAAASNRTSRAGIAASAMYISCSLVIEKGIEGNPVTTTAFFLLASHLLLFHFGFRKSNWSLGWIVSLLLMTFGFFSGGFLALLYFAFPILFFRRPLAVKSKFKKAGFWIGLLFLAGTIAHWGLISWDMSHKLPLQMTWWGQEGFLDYLKSVLFFPIDLTIRLLPWTLIAWIPFCVALQALDKTPIFSRFLRTLTFSNLALIWLLPRSDIRELLYILAPLAILTGIYYDTGMCRYGQKVRKLLPAGEWGMLVLALVIVLLCFAPERYLEIFASIEKSMDFTSEQSYQYRAWGAIILLSLAFVAIRYCRNTRPVWLILLVTAGGYAIFFGSVQIPYRAQNRQRHEFGNSLKQALANEETVPKLYKYGIVGLYSELHYSNQKIVQINELDEIPQDEKVVYLLSGEFPQIPEREWNNLLPGDFEYDGHRLMLWKGVIRLPQ